MNKWLLLFLLASPMVARAELVTPQFTQGSMNSTTTTQQDIEEDITITTYGSALNKWSGDNITHTSATSGGIADSDSRNIRQTWRCCLVWIYNNFKLCRNTYGQEIW